MTTITVPRETWDALISALENHPGNYKLTTLEAKVYQTIIVRAEALTAANAVSEQAHCRNCNGSGRMVRDPDIGTDQECFACDGVGVFDEHPQATEPAWRPIETAPKDGTAIDLWVRPYTGTARRFCGYWWLQSEEVWRTGEREKDIPAKFKPTHWMPLPAAPEAKQ